jgi:hypothetical protein
MGFENGIRKILFQTCHARKLKSLQKTLKNVENSHDLGHIRTMKPNMAKLEIFAKYFFRRFV